MTDLKVALSFPDSALRSMGATLGHAVCAPPKGHRPAVHAFFTVLGPRARSLLLLYLPMSSTYTLSDDCGLTASFTPFGATWLSAKFHDRELLGHANVAAYATERSFPGLHGGPLCQPHRRQPLCAGWAGRSSCRPTRAPTCCMAAAPATTCATGPCSTPTTASCASLHSPDGDQGFPGALDVELSYRITGPGEVRLSWTARCSSPAPSTSPTTATSTSTAPRSASMRTGCAWRPCACCPWTGPASAQGRARARQRHAL